MKAQQKLIRAVIVLIIVNCIFPIYVVASDYYKVLGIPRNAPDEQIKRAYR